MLSETQRFEIIDKALKAFERQFGVKRHINDMNLSIDKPNEGSLCSIFITSKIDDFRIKLNLVSMGVSPTMTSYRTRQLQDYGPGMEDEVVVADIQLVKKEYVAFFNYLRSPKFKAEVIDDEDIVMDEDGVSILTEEGNRLIYEDEF